MKKCGLYIRVSTDRQAKVEEGSLKNQDQLLTQHAEFKSKLSKDEWKVIDRYIDEGKSAKDTKGRPEYQRMIRDVECGKIDTVLCVALSRISRSTRDLLDMVDYFKVKNVNFVCLKEDFDTTTPQGKCFLTIMGALNEFEREQTSERTRSNMLARAERGLWNGGQIFGYDLNPDKKGYITPNDGEKALVNLCYDTYLECGSVLKTCEIITSKGHRTKQFATKAGKLHSSKEFSYTPMLKLLTNLTYIGKREINKRWMHKPQESLLEEQRYRIVKAVWEPIVDEVKFNKVQKLLKENLRHKYNGAKPTKHFYLLNGGVLHCHICGSVMEGRSAYGNHKKLYYYYCCTNKTCRYKLPEPEIESTLRDAIKFAANDEGILAKIITKTNTRLKMELPRLSSQRQRLSKELESLDGKAGYMMEKFMGVPDGEDLVRANLAKLSQRKKDLLNDISMTEITMSDIERESVDRGLLGEVFGAFEEVYKEDVKPYQRKELLASSLTKLELSNKLLKVGLPLERASTISVGTSEQISSSTSFRGAF